MAFWSETLSDLLPEGEQRQDYKQRAGEAWEKSQEFSSEVALQELSNYSPFAYNVLGAGSDRALKEFDKVLEYGRRSGDRLVIGSALDWMVYHNQWRGLTAEDEDERERRFAKALESAEEAKQQFLPITYTSPRTVVCWVEAPEAEHLWALARFETDSVTKRELLDQARKVSPDLLRRAEISQYPEAVMSAHHVISKVLASLASTRVHSEEKRELLEKALTHRNEAIRNWQQLYPYDSANIGILQDHLADINSALADLSQDRDARRKALEQAVAAKEAAIRLRKREAQLQATREDFAELAWSGEIQYELGNLMNRLHEVSGSSEWLRSAAKTFSEASEIFERAKRESRVAECCWKAAQAYDTVGEHQKASEKFSLASKNFLIAVEKIPQLKDQFQDNALYMEAWSHIEKAKQNHADLDYDSARESYEKAASEHKSTKHWNYLTSNYLAWAQVENGEDQSRKEKGQEAIEAFKVADRLFEEDREHIQAKLGDVKDQEEKDMLTNLVKAADLRRAYCNARIALEHGRILHQKGENLSSSQLYGQAAETLEKLALNVESDQTRQEIRLIANLANAWQMMSKAEAEASPGLFLDASRLFEVAKELSPNETARMLALGHSRFCKALEAGTKFADEGDAALHSAAVQHLESASKYYLNAGSKKASSFVMATKLLFDGYFYINQANNESQQDKKARLFVMAEKVLQASADNYLEAEQTARRERVLRFLERVKTERQLAVSLTEVLQTPSIISSTTAFTTPTPTYEKSVGLEKYEHANIQSNIIARKKSLKVGEDLDIDIEVINAGRGPAQLIKVEEVIPEGFDLVQRSEAYRIEDSFLNLRGKRLDPRKTEELRLALKPRVQGQFTLKPRILYLDESGEYKSHEPEPVEVTVRELGISGWLKGR